MIPQLQARLGDLERIEREAGELTRGLTPAQWGWSPGGDRWSLAQVLDHLNKTGYAVLPKFQAAATNLREQGLRADGPFRYNVLERFFIRSLSPNPPFKMPVPPMFAPTPGDPEEVWARFAALQSELKRLLTEMDGYDLKAVKIVSPASPLVRMTLGAYLDVTVAHEQYHLLQARELRQMPDFPK